MRRLALVVALLATAASGQPGEGFTFDVTAPDGGLELGPRGWPENPVVARLRNDPRAKEQEAAQRQLFELARLTPEQLARQSAPLVEVLPRALPMRPELLVEREAQLLLALRRRLLRTDERRVQVAGFALWFQRAGDELSETLGALDDMKAKGLRAALGKAHKAWEAYDKTADDSPEEQKTGEAFALTVDALAKAEPAFRGELEQWLRARVRAKQLTLAPPVVPPRGALVVQHHSRLSELRPGAPGLTFFSWDTVYRHTLERLDAEGRRTVLASGLDARAGLAPWKTGWAWLDGDGVLQHLSAHETTPTVLLSFSRFGIERWLPREGGALLMLQRRGEAPATGDAWVLASWTEGGLLRVLLRGTGSAWLLGTQDDTAVLMSRGQALLVSISRGGAPVIVPWAGRPFWSRSRGFYSLRDERRPTARLERFDVASRAFTPVAEVPGLSLHENSEELVLVTGLEPQAVTWVSPEGTLRPLDSWPFVQSVVRDGQSLLVSWFEVRRGFGGVTRVPLE